ncbi:MAG: hypothetical protein SPL80_00415 [Bacilli bacterium]|nr:hypothetical protein [Bacilli bacterium]
METTYFVFLNRITALLGDGIVSFFHGSASIIDCFEGFHLVFLEYAPGFGVGGWAFYILSLILFFGLAGSVLTAFALLLRRLILSLPKGKNGILEKEGEIKELQYALVQSTSARGAFIPQPNDERGKSEAADNGIRFPRLCALDELNNKKEEPHEAENEISLEILCQQFRHYAASNLHLYYSKENIARFVASLSASKLLILEGISGTGKTSLPHAFAKFIQSSAHICPVQPSWRERSDLLGYYNEFTGKFTETDFLVALYESRFNPAPVFIVLDEVNLARIEFYFAEFLSLLEAPSDEKKYISIIQEAKPNDPQAFVDGKLEMPENTFFVGTANNDDSTFGITSKVYDRAMVLPLDEKAEPFKEEEAPSIPVSYKKLSNLFDEAISVHPIQQEFDSLGILFSALSESLGIGFGNRFARQLHRFLPVYVSCGGTLMEGIDFFFLTKGIKKIEISSARDNKDGIRKLKDSIQAQFGKDQFPLSLKRLDELLDGGAR